MMILSDNNLTGGIFRLSNSDFKELAHHFQQVLGIRLSLDKKILVESRLNQRLRLFQFDSFKEYVPFLFSPKGQQELLYLNDLITTHKTYFYREDYHFKYLEACILPSLLKGSSSLRKKLHFWSAGCSTGEEPYTLAFFLEEFRARTPTPAPPFSYNILCSDVSISSLVTAKEAIYRGDLQMEGVPANIQKKYFLKSKERSKNLFRIVPEIREKMIFKILNLKEDFSFNPLLDVIFCRNVMIYFDEDLRHNLIHRFCKELKKGGYLITGHAESLYSKDFPLKQEETNIYRRI